MTLTPNEQPTVLRGEVVESAINTFTAQEVSVPRILSSKQLFDADLIKLIATDPIRTTEGITKTRVQLQLSDAEPTILMSEHDPKLLAYLEIVATFMRLENAAGVFVVQQATPAQTHDNKNGFEDSTRWRNFLPDDKVWLCVHNSAVTNAVTARAIIKGKLEKASQNDYDALIMSRL